MTRLVVLDADRLLRESIAHVLDAETDLEVIAHADVNDDVASRWTQWQAELIIIDPGEADKSGSWASRLSGLPEGVPVIVLSNVEDDGTLLTALRAGVAGYILKDGTTSDLLRAVRTALNGGAVLAPPLARRLIDRFSIPVDRREVSERFQLTDREFDVLRGLCRGETNAQIAALLGIGARTVKSHVSTLLSKIACTTRLEAVVFAYEHGIAATRQM